MKALATTFAFILLNGTAFAGCRSEGQALRDASFDSLLPLWQLEALLNPNKVTIVGAYNLAVKKAGFTSSNQPWTSAAVDAMFKRVSEEGRQQFKSNSRPLAIFADDVMAKILRKYFGNEHLRWIGKFVNSWSLPLSAMIGQQPGVLKRLEAERRAQSEKAEEALDRARLNYYDCQWRELEAKSPESADGVARPENPEADLSALEDLAEAILSPIESKLQQATKSCAELQKFVEDTEVEIVAGCKSLDAASDLSAKDEIRESILSTGKRRLAEGLPLWSACSSESRRVNWELESMNGRIQKISERAAEIRARIDEVPALRERMQLLINRVSMGTREMLFSASMRESSQARINRASIYELPNCVKEPPK